jgi:hypothetical protein
MFARLGMAAQPTINAVSELVIVGKVLLPLVDNRFVRSVSVWHMFVGGWGLQMTGSTDQSLLLLLGSARRDWLTLQSLLVGSIHVRTPTGACHFGARDHLVSVLAKSCLFQTIRARRLVHSCEALVSDINARDAFLAATEVARNVRNVNEHGHEPNARPKSKPSLHSHDDLDAVLDEFSMVIMGNEVLMGPLNLRHVATAVDRLFAILAGPPPPGSD